MGKRTGPWGIPRWRRRRWRLSSGQLVVLAGGLVALVVLGVMWWRAPGFYDSSDVGANARAAATATTRAGILVVCAATIAAVGAALALIETQRSNREADQRERYSKAIDQLGSPGDDKVDVRLGGIYSLQRIAEDSDRDLATVVEVLCAFVRGHGQGPEDNSYETIMRHQPPPDVQAALTVIGSVHAPPQSWVDLRGAHLERVNLSLANVSFANLTDAILIRADLTDADLTGAILTSAILTDAGLPGANLTDAGLPEANLSGAHLFEANLAGAYLPNAVLTRADLADAILTGANLVGANLTGANLRGADLAGATLHVADLTRADLANADLTRAVGIAQDHLPRAMGDARTRLPAGLTHPEHWSSQPRGSDASGGSSGDSG